jgi:hypothetical protein
VKAEDLHIVLVPLEMSVPALRALLAYYERVNLRSVVEASLAAGVEPEDTVQGLALLAGAARRRLAQLDRVKLELASA